MISEPVASHHVRSDATDHHLASRMHTTPHVFGSRSTRRVGLVPFEGMARQDRFQSADDNLKCAPCPYSALRGRLSARARRGAARRSWPIRATATRQRFPGFPPLPGGATIFSAVCASTSERRCFQTGTPRSAPCRGHGKKRALPCKDQSSVVQPVAQGDWRHAEDHQLPG